MKTITFDANTGKTTDTDDGKTNPPITNDEWFRILRMKRDSLLKETDAWAASDRTISDAQKKYRQDLRDLPANTADPSKPNWPSKP